jgi:hypothetical protein
VSIFPILGGIGEVLGRGVEEKIETSTCLTNNKSFNLGGE